MDILEKINKTFAEWYESWFGDEFGNIRPKDVLRKIINEMESNRREGLDGKLYVPNKYIIEITFANDDEREYLLAFLDKDELDNAIRKYMSENDYHLRGPLDITIEEIDASNKPGKEDKINIKCKWDARPTDHKFRNQEQVSLVIPELAIDEYSTNIIDDEDLTVASNDLYDAATVSPATLRITKPHGETEVYIMRKPSITIGRSHRLGNDIVIDDGMVSKQHARISITSQGYRIVDLGSTNGVWLNGKLINDAVLQSGDTIRLGSTQIVFQSASAETHAPQTADSSKTRAPKLSSSSGYSNHEDYLLASDMVLGRSLGCDIQIDDPSVSRKHARIYRKGNRYFIEDLQSKNATIVNDTPVDPESPIELHNGDRIRLGEVEFIFEMDQPS